MNITKQIKILYYIQSYLRLFLGKKGDYKNAIDTLKQKIDTKTLEQIQKRVDYYCKLDKKTPNSGLHQLKELKNPKSPKAYYFDTYEYTRYFPENEFIDFIFGDVIHVPNTPSIVKSRPITENNQNSVLLKLDKVRHFIRVNQDKPFSEKKDMLIGRGALYQQNRYDFYDLYFSHPLCNLGSVSKNGIGKPEWEKPKTKLEEHLDYKFILSLQGNDVATNLKWIMSSNSIAVMPKPTVETWFMEGSLQGGIHYIEIKDDYSDLEAQLSYYISHPKECQEIIQNAQAHTAPFWNPVTEDLCSLLVLEKYFNLSN